MKLTSRRMDTSTAPEPNQKLRSFRGMASPSSSLGSERRQTRGEPQPGPSRLVQNRHKRLNSGEINLSEEEDEDEVSNGDSWPGLNAKSQSSQLNSSQDQDGLSEDEDTLGPTFNFNADTPLHDFGKKLTESIRRKSREDNAASKYLFTDAEMPKTRAEIRREYSNLIERSQGFEDKEPDFDLPELLSENIIKGKQLFGKIGGGPGDMFMAFYHTKMCSGMLKRTVDMIGNSTSVFKKETFLEGVKTWSCEGQEGQEVATYSPQSAVLAIACVASECWKAVPHMVAMVGACDRKRITAPAQPKKPRAPPKRKVFSTDSNLATKHEELNCDIGKRTEPKKTRAEVVSQEMSKVLRKQYTDSRRPAPLVDFALAKTSLAETIEHIFYVGFLIRDGHASLDHQARGRKPDSVANLVIAPAEPPNKKTATQSPVDDDDDDGARNQFILSFTPKLWKTLAQASTGDDTLKVCKTKIPKSTK